MVRHTLVGLAGVLLLGGCSGTPFGEQLSRSFSTPPAAAPLAEQSAASTTNTTAQNTTDQSNRDQSNRDQSNNPDQASKADRTQNPDQGNNPDPSKLAKSSGTKAKAPAAKVLPAPVTLAPAPYRVTIKLPAADPSAPAEVVTKALRAAGVSFEVETIERVRNGGQGQGANPSVTPAPQPR
jgi:hypothetical protein